MICELEYMNMSPPPIIEFATPLSVTLAFLFDFFNTDSNKFEVNFYKVVAGSANIGL